MHRYNLWNLTRYKWKRSTNTMLVIAKNTHSLAFVNMAARALRNDGEVMLSARGKQVQRLMEITHTLMKDFDLEYDISIGTFEKQMHVECVIRCDVPEEDED